MPGIYLHFFILFFLGGRGVAISPEGRFYGQQEIIWTYLVGLLTVFFWYVCVWDFVYMRWVCVEDFVSCVCEWPQWGYVYMLFVCMRLCLHFMHMFSRLCVNIYVHESFLTCNICMCTICIFQMYVYETLYVFVWDFVLAICMCMCMSCVSVWNFTMIFFILNIINNLKYSKIVSPFLS